MVLRPDQVRVLVRADRQVDIIGDHACGFAGGAPVLLPMRCRLDGAGYHVRCRSHGFIWKRQRSMPSTGAGRGAGKYPVAR
jgi:hypothetical protein